MRVWTSRRGKLLVVLDILKFGDFNAEGSSLVTRQPAACAVNAIDAPGLRLAHRRRMPLAAPSPNALVTRVLRFCVAALFVGAGLAKLYAPEATVAVLASRDLPQPALLGALSAVCEVLGGLMLLARVHVRLACVGLAGFVVLAAGIFHMPIALAGPRALEVALDVVVLAALYGVGAYDDVPRPAQARRS
jgi:uncharacterized membrane protein YphA (DoxX/SURF4 family)